MTFFRKPFATALLSIPNTLFNYFILNNEWLVGQVEEVSSAGDPLRSVPYEPTKPDRYS